MILLQAYHWAIQAPEEGFMRGTLPLIFAATLLAASPQADAGGGHRHRHHHQHSRVGVYIGASLLLAPLWLSSRPYYYYAPAPVVVRERVIVREPLVFYDKDGNPVPPERSAQPPPQSPPQQGAVAPIWYFCPDTQTYYPYAQSCASAWQRVVPHPPPPR